MFYTSQVVFSPDFSHQPDMNDRYLYGIYWWKATSKTLPSSLDVLSRPQRQDGPGADCKLLALIDWEDLSDLSEGESGFLILVAGQKANIFFAVKQLKAVDLFTKK